MIIIALVVKGSLKLHCIKPVWRESSGGVLPPQSAHVQSLVKELRSHTPCGAGKKVKPQTKHKSSAILYSISSLFSNTCVFPSLQG